MNPRRGNILALLSLCGLAALAPAQVTVTTPTGQPVTVVVQPTSPPPVILVPQARRHVWVHEASPVKLEGVVVNLKIDGQVAVTEVELTMSNPNSVAREVQMLLPVPDGASVRSLQYDGTGPEPTAQLLKRDEARRIYDTIVGSMRDPALLEFAGMNVIRTSAFPIPPNSTQKLRITFEQLLIADGGRSDWVLPRTESFAGDLPWTLNATITSKEPIATIYSPSHELVISKDSPTQYRIAGTAANLKAAGSLRLSMLREQGKNPVATVMAYPDPSLGDGKGGFFTVLVGLPSAAPADQKSVKRELTMVLDRSGSMRGEKWTQAVAAAESVLNGLADGESFNIIDFSDSIAAYSATPVVMSKETRAKAIAYLKGLQANGGTNLRDAVLEALRPTPATGSLPLVLFMTDGLPTVGERNEGVIRESIKQANSFKRRLYTFGVGWDVNTPLLSSLARGSRAVPTYVTPDENIEVKVSQVFKRLGGPVLASPKLSVIDPATGQPSTTLTREILPAEMYDVFDGEQVVLVGQYTGASQRVKLRLEGEYYGEHNSFDFEFDMAANASSANASVPRLWAQRKIGLLIDGMRTNYADKQIDPKTDPAAKELIDEIVRLSTRYGILTEYTAFLATEPQRAISNLGALHDMVTEGTNINNVRRSGLDSAKQEGKTKDMAEQNSAPARQYIYDDSRTRERMARTPGSPPPAPASPAGGAGHMQYRYATPQAEPARMEQIEITNVNQIKDRAFFNRNNRWVEGSIVDKETEAPQTTYVLGTPEYSAFAEELIKAGLASILSLDADVYMNWKGQRVLLQNITPVVNTPPVPGTP